MGWLCSGSGASAEGGDMPRECAVGQEQGICPGTRSWGCEQETGAGTVTTGQDLEMCPGTRSRGCAHGPVLSQSWGQSLEMCRELQGPPYIAEVLGEALGGGLRPVLTRRSRYRGAGVLWDLELPIQGGQWGRGKLKAFRVDSRFTPVFLFAGFH